MKFYELLTQAKKFIDLSIENNDWQQDFKVLDFGSKWMFDRMNEISPNHSRYYDPSINFFGYGVFKYGLSILVTVLFLLLITKINLFLLPSLVIIFYFVEVHFLFLFPILFDKKTNPIATSIKYTYQIGLIHLIVNVIPIALFMIWGLFHFKNPLRSWLVGCIAILIWYKDEIRDRL